MSIVDSIPAAGTSLQVHKTVSGRIREETLRNYDTYSVSYLHSLIVRTKVTTRLWDLISVLYQKTNNLSTMRIADLHKEMSVDRMAGLLTSSFGLFCFTLTLLSSRWWMVLLFASLVSLVQQGVTVRPISKLNDHIFLMFKTEMVPSLSLAANLG